MWSWRVCCSSLVALCCHGFGSSIFSTSSASYVAALAKEIPKTFETRTGAASDSVRVVGHLIRMANMCAGAHIVLMCTGACMLLYSRRYTLRTCRHRHYLSALVNLVYSFIHHLEKLQFLGNQFMGRRLTSVVGSLTSLILASK